MSQNSYEAKVDQTLNAPLERVYEAWLNPEALPHWFGPPGHVVSEASFDARSGGKYEIKMLSPENAAYTLSGTFLEVRPYEKLVYTWRWDNPELGDYDTEVTVEFFAKDQATRVVITHKNFVSSEHCEGHKAGWLGSFERMAIYLRRTP